MEMNLWPIAHQADAYTTGLQLRPLDNTLMKDAIDHVEETHIDDII